MSGLTNKCKVILWKSYILRKRHWLLSAFEILAPLLLFYFFAKYCPTEKEGNQEYNINNVQDLGDLIKHFTARPSSSYSFGYEENVYSGYGENMISSRASRDIAYAPNSKSTKDIMSKLDATLSKTSLKGYYNITALANETMLDKWLNSKENKNKNMIGIIIKNENPKKLEYTIRIKKDQVADTSESFSLWARGLVSYFQNMFMVIQMVLDTNFIKKLTGKTPNIKLQQYPELSGGNMIIPANVFFPLITTFSFVFVMPAVIKKIVEEKLTGIKELQRMMGLNSCMLWGGWMIHSLMVYGVSAILITAMFRYPWEEREGHLLYQTDSLLIILLLLLLFIVTMVLFCFAVSSFFTSPNIGMVVGIMIWIVPTFLFFGTLISTDPASHYSQLSSCLSPPVCLSWAFSIFINIQQKGKMWSWSMFFEKGTTGGLSMAHIIFMFYVDWGLFALITWYVDAVKPGPFGRAKPFYFIFQVWKKDPEIVGSPTEEDQRMCFEAPPRESKIGISIQNLRKVFGSKVAVDRVNLDMYEGEITALLGHNGAGKTTTMSILTGLYSPSKGLVVVDGQNIFDAMDDFRQNLGLCPQHNLLFSYLTVREHLIFFGMLKGLPRNVAETSGLNLVTALHMGEKSNEFPAKLSGGMKRKLCLAIALMGDPKVLMLDEPTSGMDPESRREVWDILLSYRGERTILITTHFMEEADVLGDRIAIMDHGRVSCYGTSMFLKKLYGTGYTIIISKDQSASEAAITSLVESHLTDPQLKSSLPTQLTFNVSGQDVDKFSALFKALEGRKRELGVKSVGISCTTMEDVFLKVAEGGLPIDDKAIPAEVLLSSVPAAKKKTKVSGLQLYIQQLRALFFKKMIFVFRTWLASLIFALTPVVAVVLVLGGNMWGGETQEVKSAEMSLQDLYLDSEVPYTAVKTQTDLGQIYASLVSNQGSSPNKYSGNINQELIAHVDKDKSFYHKSVVAAEFNQTTFTGLYNSIASHSAPIALNLITNAILKAQDPSSSVTVLSEPYMGDARREERVTCVKGQFNPQMVQFEAIQECVLWVLYALSLMLAVSRFMLLPLTERATGAKQLQLMTSLPPLLYWLSHFLWDFVLFIGSLIVSWLAIWVLDTEKQYTPAGRMDLLFFLVLLYGISGIPFTYLVTYITKSSPKAMSLFLIFNLLTGIIAPLVMMTIEGIKLVSGRETGMDYEVANVLFCLNPVYAETAALIRLFAVMYMEAACKKCSPNCPVFDIWEKVSPKNTYSIRQYVLFLMIEWILFWFLITLIEFGLVKKIWAKVSTIWIGPMFKYTAIDDEDVLQEKQKTTSFRNNYNNTVPVLRVCGLGKKYNRSHVAVHEVSFLVERGQCFGLLGVNGAGKTTTFKMLTGEETPTIGTAAILSYDLVQQKSKYLQEVGYCPQFDAIIEVLTGEEMLQLFAALRGIPLDNVDSEVDNWVHFMGIEEFAKAQCGRYSGGNKRKLSTAMALVGDPPVVFLDEPTAGVDPVSRRKLWDVLAQCQRLGQAIVLTSHSMEECEALCSRLTILVGGHMKCIGTSQHLKQRFGQGYTVLLKLSATCTDYDRAIDELKTAMRHIFNNCNVKDEHKGLIHYHLTDTSVPLSQLFCSLEDLRRNHSIIDDYTVGDTTLEQVFMSFARQVQPTIVIDPVPV